jgi:hypothetical protein
VSPGGRSAVASLALAGALCAGAPIGCSGTTDTFAFPLTAGAASRAPASPVLFWRGQPVPYAPFVEVAVLQARSSDSFPAAMAALQDAARRAGADAVVDVRVEQGATELSAIGTAIAWSAR